MLSRWDARGKYADIEDNGILSDIVVCNKPVIQVSQPPHRNMTSIGSGTAGEECVEVDPLILDLRSD